MARRLHPRNHLGDQEVATDVYAKVGLRARDDRRQAARDLRAYNAMVLSEWAGLAKQTSQLEYAMWSDHAVSTSSG